MSYFKSKLTEKAMVDVMKTIPADKSTKLKNSYYDAVSSIEDALEVLKSLQKGSQYTQLTKEYKIFLDLKKSIDKSELGKYL